MKAGSTGIETNLCFQPVDPSVGNFIGPLAAYQIVWGWLLTLIGCVMNTTAFVVVPRVRIILNCRATAVSCTFFLVRTDLQSFIAR